MNLSRRHALGLAGALTLPRFALAQGDSRPSITVAVQKISTSNTLEPMREQSNVGQRVFYDMVQADQNSWAGKAFNPEDGRTYSGKMVLSGKHLRTSGCVLGGLICKSVAWVRAN